MVLTDRYDLWKFSPTGAFAPVNLTNGYGRKHHVQMRTMDPVDHYLSGTERSLDRRTNLYGPDEQVMLTAFVQVVEVAFSCACCPLLSI